MIAAPGIVRIGFVTPPAGPLAIFAEPDRHMLEAYAKAIGDGLTINGTRHPVGFIVKDCPPSSNRASTVAQEPIFDGDVTVITAMSTPGTTNPVAEQTELNGVSGVANDTPWQPRFLGRGGKPEPGFDHTFHFFRGPEDLISSFIGMWGKADTNKVVGALWPNDPDGNGWSDAALGVPPVMAECG